MLSCSASGICAICSILTKDITTRLGRTYRCTKTRRSRMPFRLLVARWRCRFWAACTINISERKFPTGTGAGSAPATVTPLGISDRLKKPSSTSPLATSSPPRERGVARLLLDLVKDAEHGKRGGGDGARGIGDRGIGVCERTRSEHGRLKLLGRRNVRDGPSEATIVVVTSVGIGGR